MNTYTDGSKKCPFGYSKYTKNDANSQDTAAYSWLQGNNKISPYGHMQFDM